ncbi:PREDICTED: EF-hand calcium-binding domain-containing protein 5, partial [Acanthisitta chloris]|uniref:EF-hand calcium-binding domain-containing protein 5 n=1 Tax=Acanthisitta chloris TaxID=57068 RepID=UPI0004F0F4ED
MVCAQKAEEEKVKKREPCDSLAREWFSDDRETLDTRIYLLDKLLPTLIPGKEHLLMAVERKHVLVSDKETTKFDPINYLGEYLMRHNPQCSVSTKPSPYLRGMKMVSEELKSMMPGTASERVGLSNLKYVYDGIFLINIPMSYRLTRMKAEAQGKCKDREEMEQMKAQVAEMRKEALAAQFREWTVDGSDRIPVALVLSALRSFPNVIASIPVDVRRAIYDRKMETLDTMEKTIHIEEFTEFVHFYTEHVSNDTFQELMEYLSQCAGDFQEATRRDTQRQMFADLFQHCDYGKVGLLDRQKILTLLGDFYARSSVSDKREFCNPRQWPIIELQEIDLVDLWGGLEDQEVCEEPSDNLVLSQTGISEGEILANEPVDEQETYGMRTSDREGIFEQMHTGEAETGESCKEENQAVESSDAEGRRGEGTVSVVKSAGVEASDLDGDPTQSEKSSSHGDIKTERETESGSADRQEEASSGSGSAGDSLGRDGEDGSEKQVKEEEFSLGREPETETQSEGDHILDREPGSEEQVSQEDNGIAETISSISGPTPETTTTSSGDRAVADMDVTDSEQDASAAEAVKETPVRKESFSSQHSSQSGQQTSSETSLEHKDLLHHQDSAPSMAEIQNHQASCTRSSFDASWLTLPQFVHLMETFVGDDISLPTLNRLIDFIKEEYKQTGEEKMEQLIRVHHTYRVARRKLLLEALFEKWDSSAAGFLDLGEVDAVLSTFKEGMEKEALGKAKEQLCSRYPQLSRVGKLSPKTFQTFLELIASEFSGNEDEAVSDLVEFLTTRVEQSHRESVQSLTRRKWLQDIQQVAETSGATMESVYEAVFKALSQDAEAHGGNKKISAYIALLEGNQQPLEQGQILLRYVASTADDAPYVLNQVLYRHMKGVSFVAVEEGKPIHVPRVQFHGNIHFWNHDRPVEQRKGSFLVLPLHDAHWRVFGILGVDTLRDQCEQTVFLSHEISFYQGVSHAFSRAYHHICTLENVLQMAGTALDWLYPRTPNIHSVTMYLVEPGKDKTQDYALCKMITTDNTGQKEIHSSPVLLLREENLLRDYMFKCTDSSEVTCTSVRGEHHIAVPLRDLSGQALGIFDISIGPKQKLPPEEQKELQKMLKVVQAAYTEILRMSLEETEPTYVLEAEHVAGVRHAGILFHRFVLQDLRQCVRTLGEESFTGIKSCAEPPALVHHIVKAVLLLLHPDWKGSEETESWSQCKLKLDDNLIQEIYCFDPTAASVQAEAELVLDCIA